MFCTIHSRKCFFMFVLSVKKMFPYCSCFSFVASYDGITDD